jgi:hypothetical protein
MFDIQERLRKAFSALAGNEALSSVADENAAADLLKWSEEIAEALVRETGEMEEAEAEEFLSPYMRALRTLMRSVGRWLEEQDSAVRVQWWARMEQAGKTLYGDAFGLPPMEAALAQLPTDASPQQVIALIKSIFESQRTKG